MGQLSVVLCVLLVICVAAASIHALTQLQLSVLDGTPGHINLLTLVLRGTAACLWSTTLYCSYRYLDMKIDGQVQCL